MRVAVLVGSGVRGRRGPVVTGVLERVGQPLLQLGGGVGERLSERSIQRQAHGGDAFAVLALPRQHVAAQALDAQQQIGPSAGLGVCRGGLQGSQGSGEAGC